MSACSTCGRAALERVEATPICDLCDGPCKHTVRCARCGEYQCGRAAEALANGEYALAMLREASGVVPS